MTKSIASELRTRVRGSVISGDLLLDDHRTNFGRLFHWEPAAVVRPDNPADVVATLQFARREGIPVTTRGAAHSQSQVAINEGGILLDMKSMHRIGAIDRKAGTVEVESGAIWRDVMLHTWREQLTPPVLTNNLSVTVGGTLSSGGVGVASFRHGTQCDQVRALDVVTGAGDRVRCSPEENADLFDAVRAGLGQCAVITGATLALRAARSMVRTYYTLYDDLDRFLADSRLLIDENRFDHMESWCSPCPMGFRTGPQGRRPFARWYFPYHLSVEFEPGREPDQADLLRGLGFREHLHTEDLPTPMFFRRLEPLFDLWKRGGTWEHAHPWMETVLPMDRAADFIRETIRDLPPQVIVGGHILLWVSSGSVSDVPLFMHPTTPHVVGFGILPAVPHRWIESIRPRLEMLSDLSIEHDGKRYLSGYVNFDLDTWRGHYGDRWEWFRDAKKRYDPDGILNRGFVPLLESESATAAAPAAAPAAGGGPQPFGSAPWVDAVRTAIAADEAYRTAARGWGVGFNGDLLFDIGAGGPLTTPVRFVLRLRDGHCLDAAVVEADPDPAAGFTLTGPFPIWKQILEGRVRPVTALMTRRLQVKGSVSTLLKFTRAAQLLLRAVASVPTRFPS